MLMIMAMLLAALRPGVQQPGCPALREQQQGHVSTAGAPGICSGVAAGCAALPASDGR